MTDRQPVAYIRRSAADAGNPGDVSRDVQEAAVRELAHRDGHNGDVRYFVDWAKSAAEEKEAARTEFRAMLAEVEAGRASVIYSYSLDRLARSTTTFARLLKAAKDKNVRVVTHREGDLSDNGNPTSWAFGFLVSFFAEFELRMAKSRAAAAQERRRARGDRFGHAPFGYRHVKENGTIVRVRDETVDLEQILSAYREAGSVLGACRLLEARGVPAPKGGKRWATSAFTRIIDREAPELMPRRGPTGRRTPATAALAQLLQCHCGQTMTPNLKRGQYYCSRGHREGSAVHGRMAVREADIMPWIEAEAARLAVPGDAIEAAGHNAGRREALEAKRADVIDMYLERVIRDKAERDRRLETIDREIANLDLRADAVSVIPEAVDFDWPADKLNTVLRSMWRHVELGPDMRPVAAEWIIPEWRQ